MTINKKLLVTETITYHNNSADELPYLWVQLDQNMRAADSKTPDISSGKVPKKLPVKRWYDRAFPEKDFRWWI